MTARIVIVLMLFITCNYPVQACSIPVFRYALENWKPSPYPIQIVHRGPLSESQLLLLTRLKEASANLTVTTLDLEGNSPPSYLTKSTLPCIVVHYPDAEEGAPPAWICPLDDEHVHSLLDSPCRRQIIDLLRRGTSAVWVVVETEDPRANQDKLRLLDRELIRLQRELRLPELDTDTTLRSNLPLTLSFASVRVSRTDPREAPFLALLLGWDNDLRQVPGPLVFPVMGRGRMLLGLHGKNFAAAPLERWASFLCGPCSCRVKELNPGVDLLLQTDWEDLLDQADGPAASSTNPPLPSPAIPPGRTQAPGLPAQEDSPSSTGGWFWILVAACGLVGLLIGILGRQKPSSSSSVTPHE